MKLMELREDRTKNRRKEGTAKAVKGITADIGP